MRILYLTHPYTSTGAVCLNGLLEAGIDVVGVVLPRVEYKYKNGGFLKSTATFIRRRGIEFFLLTAWRVLSARVRIWIRRYVPKGSALIPNCATVDELAEIRPFPILRPERLNGRGFLDDVSKLRPDWLVIVYSDRIVKLPLLKQMGVGAMNLHPSPLPRYRGPDPLYWQLVKGERRGGITVHHVTAEIDGGDILFQEMFDIDPGESEASLKRKVDNLAPQVLLKAIDAIRQGIVKDSPQDAAVATYFPDRPRGLMACFPRCSR